MKQNEEEIIKRINESLEQIKTEINKMDSKGEGFSLQIRMGRINPSTVLVRPPVREIELIRQILR